MKNLFLAMGLLLSCLVTTVRLDGVAHFESIYPPVVQRISGTTIFSGDHHGEFEGDYLSVLSDGSSWKVHPDSRETYGSWEPGELVRIKVRTDWYWFNRQHKFVLYNYTRGESVKAMLIGHKDYPVPLQVLTTETYAKSMRYVAVPEYVRKIKSDGKVVREIVYRYEWQPCDYRKVLGLSDGSFWVVKSNFNDFMLGTRVYIGAQGHPTNHYDFILITGDQREAAWAYARPQK